MNYRDRPSGRPRFAVAFMLCGMTTVVVFYFLLGMGSGSLLTWGVSRARRHGHR